MPYLPPSDATDRRDLARLTRRVLDAVKIVEGKAWEIDTEAALELFQACQAVERALSRLNPCP